HLTLNVQHPYKPLVEAIKKFKVAKNALAQVAWNFVNDGYDLLPSDGEKVWWQEFDVTPHQLEGWCHPLNHLHIQIVNPIGQPLFPWLNAMIISVIAMCMDGYLLPIMLGIFFKRTNPILLMGKVSNQILELYEQNRISPSQESEVEASGGGATRSATKAPGSNEEQASKHTSSHPAPYHSSAENHVVAPMGTENQSNDGSAEMGSEITDHKADLEIRESRNSEQFPLKDNKREVKNRSKFGTERIVSGDQDRIVGTKEASEVGRKDDLGSHKYSSVGQNMELREGPTKVKAALEKKRKERGEMTLKKDVMDEDDLIERELKD
ncbi:hypothetical protein HN51_065903, partial [Arachis hypogaea]